MRSRDDRGQATVELALCLPLLALVATALVEVGSIAVDRTRVWHAAREAARVAIVDADPQTIRAAATRDIPSISVQVDPPPEARIQGEPLHVHVTYQRDVVPLLGAVFGDVVMSADAVMRIERP
ncbi:MAG: hypothetical protein QOG16_1549 [Actinomycetota bacterium]|jgi:hypothetical protein|nr:hypothetical protein [Actinomycetota bacterium]